MAEIIIDDRDWSTLSDEDKNEIWMTRFGKPYTPPTDEEKEAARIKYNLDRFLSAK